MKINSKPQNKTKLMPLVIQSVIIPNHKTKQLLQEQPWNCCSKQMNMVLLRKLE